MKILQTIAGARHGGAEAFFTRLVIALHQAGVKQHIVMRRDKDRSAQLRRAGLHPVEARFGGPLDLLTRWTLKREIRKYRPAVVLSWMQRAAAAVPIDGPFVHVGRLGGYYNLKYFQHCDFLVTNTRDLSRYVVQNGWPVDRVVVLPNFVDAAPAKPIMRQTLQTPNNAPVVLALGRLHTNKGFDILLEAVSMVPGVYLWLAGEGPEKAALEALVARYGLESYVRFLGWRKDTAALYAAADLVVVSSRHEPLGNVVLEAWAHQRPVVAVASEGPKELIEDGVSGLLVEIPHAQRLADAIQRVICDFDFGKQLAAGGRAAYQRDFTEEAVVHRFITFFEAISR